MEGFAAHLEVVAGKAVGMSIVVEDELLIGRQADGAGRLADDDEISRSHARVTLDTSGFCAIEDLGSTNGTFLNGLRISGPQTLSEGDTIELGGTTLVVRELPSLEPDKQAAPAVEQPTVIPGAAPAQPGPPPTLSVRFEVDFAGREARIVVDEASEPIRLRLDNGEWRIAPPSD
jgi:pSer/pThr/pTyr-binding forkhead associated (FHA) protein